MKFICQLLLLMLMTEYSFVTCPTYGQLGPLDICGSAPEAVYPQQHVRMDSMNMTMKLKKTSYSVDSIFHFFNAGETTIEWVIFLKEGDISDFQRYDIWVDGEKLKVSGRSWIGLKLRSLGRSLPPTSWTRHQLNRFWKFLERPSPPRFLDYTTSCISWKSSNDHSYEL